MAAKPGTSPRGTPGKGGGDVRTGEAEVHTFRSPTALVVWVVWLLFAVGNWIDIAVQGRDHLSVVAAAILLLATGVIYACAQRPRIIADSGGVTIRNPLRDHRISWAAISDVDLVDLLRVHCDWGPPGAPADGDANAKKHRKVISSWAVHYSRRRQLSNEAKARRAANPRRSPLSAGFPSYGSRGLSANSQSATPEAEAERIARLLREHATAARAESVWARGTAATTPAASDATPADTPASATTIAAPTPDSTPVPLTAGWAEPPRSTWSRAALAAILVPALILLIVCLV
jgi:hypothetical protein